MRYSVLLLAALAMSACTGGCPVGHYDPRRVSAESRVAREALAPLQQRVQQSQKRAQQLDADVEKANEVTVADKRALAAAAHGDLDAAQRALDLAGERLGQLVVAAVTKLARDRHMTMVVPFAGKLPYAAPETELTDALIGQLDGVSRELAEARRQEREASDRRRQLEEARPPTSDGGLVSQ